MTQSQPNQYEDKDIGIRQRIVNCFNGDDTVPTRAIDNLEALITQKQLEARIDERTQLAIEMAGLTNFTEKAFDDIAQSNHERIEVLKKGLQE